jgi:hypothetical protein
MLFNSYSYPLLNIVHIPPSTNSKEAMKQLKELGGVANTPTATPGKGKGKASVTDCCICLFSVTVHQALFIA